MSKEVYYKEMPYPATNPDKEGYYRFIAGPFTGTAFYSQERGRFQDHKGDKIYDVTQWFKPVKISVDKSLVDKILFICAIPAVGLADCNYGDTQFDSLSVCFGINLTLDHIKAEIEKQTISHSNKKTLIKDWIKLPHTPYNNRTTRVLNGLNCYLSGLSEDQRREAYVEDISRRKFLQMRNAGETSWKEFCRLTGREYSLNKQ